MHQHQTVGPRPRLIVTRDGHQLDVSPARARALTALGRRRGASSYLGARLSRCWPCAAARIDRVLRRMAGRASSVGRLRTRSGTYRVFVADGGRNRLLARPLRNGAFAVIMADRARPAAPAPHSLDELAQAELQYDTHVEPMRTRTVWGREPISLAEARKLQKSGRNHLLYLGIDAAGRPVKVGESTKLATRYTRKRAAQAGIDKVYVGRVVDEKGRTLMGPYVTDAERVTARKLEKIGVSLPGHKKPNPNEPIVTTKGKRIRHERVLPVAVRKKQLESLQAQSRTAANRKQIAEARKANATVDGRNPYEIGATVLGEIIREVTRISQGAAHLHREPS